ncbi:glycosyltransferase family 4 protein [Methylobacillus gramineus]|uniref:glycosyltransferase family 4 protein n=1 Tax=Methylobacillus gramineus TaxID=755169 RepID=UPI001CFFD6A7|nr:glycosyltransferase family 4 protein [Methylobacillus gramineus]MCB5184583.1 glycosyltransferase family 4 protein [Methylobacillus gramineus]
MNILFIHQNFPGQFRHIAQSLIDEGQHQVLSLCEAHAPGMAGVQRLEYKPARNATEGVHAYLAPIEGHVIRGQSVARALLQLKERGYQPDVIVAHMGWGEAIYPKDIYPDTPLLTFFEFFYQTHGADAGFDPEYPLVLDDYLRIRTKNITNLLSLNAADIGISPTAWQRNLYPAAYRDKIRLIHEGINTEAAIPDRSAWIRLGSGLILTRQDEVITYVSRNLEPYRGFHIFMRALPEILKRRPHCQVLIVGGDDVSYGRKLPDGQTYRAQLLQEVQGLDRSRVHFLGKLPYQQYLRVLQISSAHLYLTVPFVLSWSMLEAMSAGCLVIGSKTAPVEEVITHEENGLLVDFFSTEEIANAVDRVFADPDRLQAMRDAARSTIVQHYPLTAGVQAYRTLFEDALGPTPPQP